MPHCFRLNEWLAISAQSCLMHYLPEDLFVGRIKVSLLDKEALSEAL